MFIPWVNVWVTHSQLLTALVLRPAQEVQRVSLGVVRVAETCHIARSINLCSL